MIKSSLFLIKVRIIHLFYIDLNYLIHFSFLIVIRGIKYKSNQYLAIVKKAIDGDRSKMFPTTITSIIGNSLLLSYIVNNPDYYQILNLIGMIKYMKNQLKNRNVIYVNEETLYSDTQVMNIDSVVIATYTAVADLNILGNSQTCLMTGESIFEYIGCAISGRIPYIIYMKNEVIDEYCLI